MSNPSSPRDHSGSSLISSAASAALPGDNNNNSSYTAHSNLNNSNNHDNPADDMLKDTDLTSVTNNAAFDALERDFRSVLNELVGDRSLERFRLEYEKLHYTLKKSHDNEKRLIKKCRELNGEIVSNAAKIQTALRLSLQDQNSISLLKKEIDKAWKMVDSAQEKEKKARETITRLKGEITSLSKLVDQGAGLSQGQEAAVADLLNIKQNLTNQIQVQHSTIDKQNHSISDLNSEIERLNAKISSTSRDNSTYIDKMNEFKQEIERQFRRAERLQAELISIKDVNDKRKAENEHKVEELSVLSGKYSETEQKVRQYTQTIQDYAVETQELKQKTQDLEKLIEFNNDKLSQLTQSKENVVEENKLLKSTVKQLQTTINSAKKAASKLEKDKNQLVEVNDSQEEYKSWLKSELKTVLKTIEQQQKDSEIDEKLIKELQLQIKRLTINLHYNADKNNMQLKLVEQQESTKKLLEGELINQKNEVNSLRAKNYAVEKEKEKEQIKANAWFIKFNQSQEEIKLRMMENVELKKAISEEKNKLKLQQHLYEQVRSDRNIFSKQQTASEDTISEMKRKFTIMQHQIEQLKEEIATKDAALINQHFAYKRMQDEMKIQKRKLSKRKELLNKADLVLASQDTEISNLRKTLAEAEIAQTAQNKIYEDVINERDIMGTQLIRRNDELALLYEKIRIQQSSLNKGETQYRDRIGELQRMKLTLANQGRQMQIHLHEQANIQALKNEIYHIQRELLSERTKVKALSEELENPMNVHRWRKLEGSDPKTFELIVKIQTLQKRLIKATEELVEKDLLIKEKEQLYIQLKNLLARQPGPEISEQLAKYQQTLKLKNKQIKAMAAELNMLNANAQESKYEMERIGSELNQTKKLFFQSKKNQQLMQQAQNNPNNPAMQQQQLFIQTQPRIAGGGFNLHNNSMNATQ
jgi:chromosome segregation ATPase